MARILVRAHVGSNFEVMVSPVFMRIAMEPC